MSLVIERFLICDGCGENFGVDNRHKTGGQHRIEAKRHGWGHYVSSGKNQDLCESCKPKKVEP
jgi:hypothetical protein